MNPSYRSDSLGAWLRGAALGWGVVVAAVLGGCASTPGAGVSEALRSQPLPEAWQAPMPHQGAVTQLAAWWQQQGDPVLLAWIEAAQAASPSVATAYARVQAARAAQVTAGAVLLPQVDAAWSVSRGVSQPEIPVATSQSVGLQAAWELDLWGANRALSDASQAAAQGAQAQWHDARVAVAAELASAYYGLRTCLQQNALAQRDAASQQTTADLAQRSAQAGLASAASAALAQASAAQARDRASQQAAACALSTKALVALTALPEPTLRAQLAAAPQDAQAADGTVSTIPAIPSIPSLPAQTLAQRPDVFAAERDVRLAHAQLEQTQAQRYPRLRLSGAIGALRYSSQGTDTELSTWSLGPLALTLPLLDGGQRRANTEQAQANYAQAVAAYRAKVRQAVREVEEALVQLASTTQRSEDAHTARRGYARALAAAQARYDQGLANRSELEEARRAAWAAESAQWAVQLERQRAVVGLYRAAGGGWQAQDLVDADKAPAAAPAGDGPQ